MSQTGFQTENNPCKAAAQDIFGGLRQWRLWSALAREDIRSRYMRSFIGISWVTISFAIFVAVKILIFTPMSETNVSFFAPYVAIGFFAWTFMNSVIVDGCVAFIGAASWIKGARMPLSIYAYQSIMRNLFLTIFNFIVVIGVMVLSKRSVPMVGLVAIPVFLLYIVNAAWIHILFSTIAARYRDFMHMTQTIMRVMFFLTPIFWLPENMGGMMKILNYNPLAHFIYALRDPILYGTVPMTSIWIVIATTIIGCLLAYLAMVYGRRKIVFWL
ncbi:MAG: ABC transporter permease [Parvularculaceae bacterium]